MANLNLPTIISFHEIMIIYNCTKGAAQRKLSTIRAMLGKKSSQKLSIIAFCKAEGLELDEFDIMYCRAIKKIP